MEDIKLFKHKLFDLMDLGELAFNFSINIVVLLIIIKLIYLPINKNREFIFTFFVFNVVIFFLCSIMGNTNVNSGFGFGLFAILSIMRYRTESVPIKEMTYLFISISISVINALLNKKIAMDEIIFCNGAIIATVYILEKMWVKSREHTRILIYEKIELIKPERREELFQDLKDRTGLDIQNIDIVKIDLLSDSASLRIHYKE
jgi:Domain of unknown function (DUF4956)